MKSTAIKKTLLALAITTTLVGCDSLSDGQRTGVGAGIGGVLGAVIGNSIDQNGGAVVGGLVGALAGGAIAYYMDSQQEKLEKALASSGIEVVRLDEATIKLVMPNSITFAVAKSDLSPSIQPTLAQLSTVVNEYTKTIIHIEGHTDNTGSLEVNEKLSLDRANAVAGFLVGHGVMAQRIVGAGHNYKYPVASNDSEAGRAQNRRSEIFIRAIEKGNENAAYAPIY